MKQYKNYYLTFIVIPFLVFHFSSFAQAPANDNICNALPLEVGLSCKSFTNKAATNSPNPSATANPPCWAAAPGEDVWISFVATAPDMSVSTDVALFELIPSGANLADTEVAVYSSSDNTCSGTLTLIGCDEDSGINSLLNATTLLSIVEMTGLVVGKTYFIRVDGNGTSTGAFCLSVFDTYTPGSKPCEAHVVHPNSSACDTLNGNKLINATSSNTAKVKGVAAGAYLPLGQDYCGADNETAQYGTWTTFVGNSNGNITVTNFAPTSVDYTLFSGNCVNMTCIGSQSATVGGNTVFTGIVSGTTYFILTTLQGGVTNDAVTTDLCVSNTVPQTHPPTEKNDGTGGFVDTDSCEIAYGVTIDQVYQTTTYGAKNDGGSGCKLGKNIWFYWDVPPGYPAGPVFFQLWNKNCTGGPGNPGIRLIVNPSTSCTGGMGCQEVTTPKSDQNTNVGWDSGYSTRYYLDFVGDGDENCDFNFMVGSLPVIPGVKVNSTTICEGESANLTAFNAYEYSWSTGETTASITVAPSTLGVSSYTVTAIKGASGSDVANVTLVSAANCPTGPVCAKTYTTQGTFAWTAPACVNSVTVECWGGGGAGGGTSNSNFNNIGGGGGGGAYTKSTVPVVPGNTYTVTVAAAALGGTGSGPDGNSSTFRDANTILVTGAGGKGGALDTGVGGAGGIGTFNGGTGSSGDPGSGGAGGGGGGAGSTGSGVSAATGSGSGTGGAGGAGGGGKGGDGGNANGTDGTAGLVLGGGGGGADGGGGFSATPTQKGGDGANGKVTITCTLSTATITVNDATICAGETATLTASGASVYSWSPGSSTTNTLVISPALTTSYTVTQGGGGCSDTAVATVTVQSVTVTVNDATICSGQSATLTASGASTYSWSLGGSIANPLIDSPASPTSYTVTGTTGGCSGTAVSNITVAGSLSVSVNDATICSGQSATLTASGASTYLWSTTETTPSISVSPASPTSYTVTGTTNGCSGTAVSNIAIGGGVSVIVNDATICNGQSAVLTASGGTSYDWSPATGLSATTGTSVTANPTIPTTYTVTDNSGGCGAPGYSVVTVNSLDDATFSYTPSTVCKTGGSDPVAVISGTSGGTFTCNPALIINSSTGLIDLASTTPATYTVTYTTNGTCPDTKTFVLAIVTASDATFNYTGPYCQNAIPNATPTFSGSASAGIFSSSAGLSFVNTGTGEIDLLASAPNTYTVTNTIAASGSCLASVATNTVIINASPVTTINSETICIGSSATLTASGATTYLWSDSDINNPKTVSPTTPTSYTVTGTTAGCSSSAIGTITANPVPTVTVNDATVCTGQTGTLTASGATSYSWSNGFNGNPLTDNPATTTPYTVTGTSAGCSSSAIGTITVSGALNVTVNSPAICQGLSAIVTASGAATYVWSDGTTANPKIVSPTTTTPYGVTGTSSGCTGTAVAIVTVNSLPNVTVNSATICAGGGAILTASGGSTYVWSTGASGNTITVTPTTPTSYTVSDNTAGCSGSAIANVTVNPSTTVIVNSLTICRGETAILTASGANNYVWSNGSTTDSIAVSPTGDVSYTVTGNPGTCSTKSVSTVTVKPLPNMAVNFASICRGDAVVLTASGAIAYIWSPSGGLSDTIGTSVTASPNITMSYIVTGTAPNGCNNYATSNVIVSEPPSIDPGNDITIVRGTSVQIVASGAMVYTWLPSTGLSCDDCPDPVASPLVTTKYCVNAIDINNCVDSACITVNIQIPCPENKNMVVPNAFSPNNDGSNDVLILHGWEKCISQFTFVIFDRWGEKVFESDDPLKTWDGIFRGKPLDPAVFIYFIEATFTSNEKISKKGNISLIH